MVDSKDIKLTLGYKFKHLNTLIHSFAMKNTVKLIYHYLQTIYKKRTFPLVKDTLNITGKKLPIYTLQNYIIVTYVELIKGMR